MLLPNVADVILPPSVLADDIAMVVDVETTQGDWCYGRVLKPYVADVIASCQHLF